MERRLGQKEKIKESVILIQSPTAKDIAKIFFREYSYTQKVGREKYGKRSSTVEYFFKIWDKKGYFEKKELREVNKTSKKKKAYQSTQLHYLLNLEPYFLYLKNKGINLTKEQMNFLSKKFDLDLRQEIDYSVGSLFDIIDRTIREEIILAYIKNQFFKLLGRKNNELIRNKSEEKMIVNLMKIYSDRLTKESVLNYFKLYLFNLIRENNFSNFTDYLCEIIEAIEGKKELPKNIFFIGAMGGFDITKIITPLYKKMKKANPEERKKIIEHFRLNSAWYGYEKVSSEST